MGVDKTKNDEKPILQGGLTAGEGSEGAVAAPVTEADRRRERAAQKLRENLGRRKQQVRARRAGQADETDGLPAANTAPEKAVAAKTDESS